MPPFIYINGHPGVGKLTIAKELQKLIPASKVFDNHLIIDPVAAILERNDPEYLALRTSFRQLALDAIVTTKSSREIPWIFTDQRSSDAIGTAGVMDYRNAGEKRGGPVISIVLDCELEENLRRATSAERQSGLTTKLTDTSIIRAVRKESLYRFRDEYELELDVTQLTVREAAARIAEHVQKWL